MEGEEKYENPESLRRRIAELETDVVAARRATEEVQERLETTQNELKHHEHSRHAARNLQSYGHREDIVFVHPEDLDQGLIYRMSRGDGARATVCRYMVHYNIDQFFQRPKLHQWMTAGKLYREATDMASSRFELFFDLLFVGMAHQLSEAAAEQPTGLGLAVYVLTFAPAYSIWADIRVLANHFSNDDVTQRAYILWTMLLLIGYSSNASAIQIHHEDAVSLVTRASEAAAEGATEVASTGSGSFDANIKALNWALGFFVIAKVSRALLSLVYAAFLPFSRRPLIYAALNPAFMAVVFLIALFTSLKATIILVVVGIIGGDVALQFLSVVLYKTFEALGRKYDRIRERRMEQQVINPQRADTDDHDNPDVLEGLQTTNSSTTAVDEQPPMAMGDVKMCRKLAARRTLRYPAVNIEHHVERMGAFVTIVLGEMVVAVFIAAGGAIGLNQESGRAMLCLMIAFNFNWLYFDSAITRHFTHAIRRHWVAGYLFTLFHLPLCMALLLASAAVHTLVTDPYIEHDVVGLKWFFGAGLGVSLCIMAAIGVLHRNLDNKDGLTPVDTLPSLHKWGHHHHHKSGGRRKRIPRTTISRRIVIGFRFLAGIAMCLIPLAEALSTLEFLSIYAGITALLIFEETIARIEKRDQELDEVESAQEEDIKVVKE
ncbi:hypothetical protein MKEN_00247600 [Mycena kentingensis (nom. inval.)]|nr:hypothetical protein MKEN_00247600 [Mycena kentingensis (nom. inval.)]